MVEFTSKHPAMDKQLRVNALPIGQ